MEFGEDSRHVEVTKHRDVTDNLPKNTSSEDEADILDERKKDPYTKSYPGNRRKNRVFKATERHFSLNVDEDIQLYKIQHLSESALVGRLENTKVTFEAMRDWLNSYWRPILKYKPLFTTLVNGWFIFHLLNSKDRDMIAQKTWLIGRGSLVLQKWTVGFNPNQEQLKVRHLWVSLWGLPIQFWEKKLLIRLANTIGKFLFLDELMFRSHDRRRALLLVEFRMEEGLPENIDIIWNGEIYNQKIDYLFVPFRCFRCQKTGHLRSQCNAKQPAVSSRTSYHSMGAAKKYRVRASAVPGSGSSDKDSQSGMAYSSYKYKLEDLSVEELAIIDNLEEKAMFKEKAPPSPQSNELDRSDTHIISTEHETSSESEGVGQASCLGGEKDKDNIPDLVGASESIHHSHSLQHIVGKDLSKEGQTSQTVEDFPPGFSEGGDRVSHSLSGSQSKVVDVSIMVPGLEGQGLGSPMPPSYRDIVLAHLPVYKDSPKKKTKVSPFKLKNPHVTIRKKRKGRRIIDCDENEKSEPLSSRLNYDIEEVDGGDGGEAGHIVEVLEGSGALRGKPLKGGDK